jgi:hypothetical protein
MNPLGKSRPKKGGRSALDNLINVPTQQPEDPCYHEPVMIFFGSDKTGRWYSVLRDFKNYLTSESLCSDPL